MKEIVIQFQPFVFKQTVFIKEKESGEIIQQKIPQKELATYISLQQNVETVHFFGNAKFADKIKNECITKYKMNNVNILINK